MFPKQESTVRFSQLNPGLCCPYSSGRKTTQQRGGSPESRIPCPGGNTQVPSFVSPTQLQHLPQKCFANSAREKEAKGSVVLAYSPLHCLGKCISRPASLRLAIHPSTKIYFKSTNFPAFVFPLSEPQKSLYKHLLDYNIALYSIYGIPVNQGCRRSLSGVTF